MKKKTEEQPKKQPRSRAEHLKPWQFQPGVSGNPKGREKGSKSLKTFAQEYLLSLNDEEKLEYMKGMDKKVIWEMAEDKPKQGTEVSGNLTLSEVLDSLEDGNTTEKQGLED